MYDICSLMIGKCDNCGLENVELMSIRMGGSQDKRNLCNQCRPADGTYAYWLSIVDNLVIDK